MHLFDRDIYFGEVRHSLFKGSLTQSQVDGQSLILAIWEYQQPATLMNDIRWLAYMLATVIHETAATMWPNQEYGSEEYLKGKKYYPYFGRGFVHLTWEDNYAYASEMLGLYEERDLVEHPEMARDSLIATRIMFLGMAEGWFTGRKLSQYFDTEEDDPVNARQIINGNDQDTLIASYHEDFLSALQTAKVAQKG